MQTHLRILAWNLRGRARALEPLESLCSELEPHLLVICEAPPRMLSRLTRLRPDAVQVSRRPGSLAVFALDSSLPITALGSSAYGEAFELTPAGQPSMLVVAVHLESQVWLQSSSDQRLIANETHELVERFEDACQTEHTVVIGDFNMDPFTPAMVDIGGLNAVMCRRRAGRVVRTTRRVSRRMFYNPMWNLLGDVEAPPGSYYWQKTQAEGYFWHMLDQVLVRPIFAERISRLQIITRTGTTALTSASGLPLRGVSDHLPIFVELDLRPSEDPHE